MSAHERVYRLLLRAYPATFRADFERQMLLAFRDMRRESRGDWPALWAALLWDLARSAPALRAAEVRARWTCDIQLEEGTMRPMAILMVLVGAVELGNAAFEGWAGGVARGDGISLLGGSMGTVAGLVLMIAGVAMLRRPAAAASWARGAAIACFAVYAVIGVLARLHLSIFTVGLGIVFPLAVLVFLRSTQGRPTPTAT